MKPRVSLSGFNPSHLELLRQWLAQPHVRRWYPAPESNLEWASCPPRDGGQLLIEAKGEPVGYLRWQLVSRAVLDSLGLTQVPGNAADVDILIGDERYISQGAGPIALSELAARFRERGDIPLIGLTTSRDNTVAHKAFLKAGFKKSRSTPPKDLASAIFSL